MCLLENSCGEDSSFLEPGQHMIVQLTVSKFCRLQLNINVYNLNINVK